MGLFGFGKKKTVVAEGPWDFYNYSYGDGLRASITFHVRFDSDGPQRGYQACRRVVMYLPHDRVRADGLPTGEEYQRSADREAAFIAELERAGVDCLKVGHMLYGAMRDVVFQVEDTAGFAAAFKRWKTSDEKAELIEKEGWSFFNEKIRPTPVHRKWIANNHLVIQLLKAGANHDRPHTLDHTFLGEPSNLDTVARELAARGFPSQRPDPTRLTIAQTLPLDPDGITTWTLRFESLAQTYQANYDGWGAAVLR